MCFARGNHDGHTITDIEHADEKQTEIINKMIESLRVKMDNSKNLKNNIEIKADRLRGDCKIMQEEIEKFYDGMLLKIEEEKNKVLLKLNGAIDGFIE